ncbi:AraC family transcriptional regulator [Klebsiella indica]|uniref:Helix-turn-helix transcriptional regulator n=1 Tax=Klebsiella indica TaxID=2582917 RepID=A0A5R9LNJ5_9ENTR|nr:AraC family transcriptional regulator [Klebsiella indica]TLV22983.1 helix-turn-helix transcriptional regulator [Klebsiella indica]
MSRPTALYVPHVLSTEDIAPDARYQLLSQDIRCYGLHVVNNRRPEDIVANHKTISGVNGDYCSAMGSRNETIFDPHQTTASSIYISLIVHGNQIIHSHNNSATTQLNQGTLIVHQRNDYYHYQCNDVKQLYVIPRSDMTNDVFNGKLRSPIVSLENHHLANFLKSHMLLLDRQSAMLSSKETATIVDGLHNIALIMLADVAKEKGLFTPGKLSHLFNGAKSFIIQNYHQHNLSPNVLTQHLRCSRASLDRAFNEQKTSVMTLIKEIRLEAAREMLENNRHLRIEQISWICGFVSHPLFSKQFREKYLVSPKTWRDNYNKAS